MPVLRLPNPLIALDDRALLARFADQRDQRAFEQVVKRHGALVYGVCKRAVRDRHLAEDAFQAVFLVLARNPTRAAEAASVGGWLFGIARRVGLAARRHESRREKREHADALRPPTVGEPFPRAEFDEVHRVLDEELAALPEDVRAALVACFLEEQTQDEAARGLGWSLSTLRRRLERGKELLRARLARRGVALAAGLLTAAVAGPARAAVPPLAAAPSHVTVQLAAAVFRAGLFTKFAPMALVAVVAAGGLALGLAREPDPPANPPEKGANAELVTLAPQVEVAPAPRPVEAHKWVTVSGRVVFPKGRDAPKLRLVPAGQIKDADVWKPFGELCFEDVLVHPDTRGVANVVVFLRPDTDRIADKFPVAAIPFALRDPKPVARTVVAVGGQFVPRVLAARVGDTVTFDNQLPVPTNVLYSCFGGGDDRSFNILLGREMSHTSKPLPAMLIPDMYHSSIYRWMTGFVWAFDHPYYAVTDDRGNFTIRDVPSGTWRLVAWHETTGWRGGAPGKLGMKVTVPGRNQKFELEPIEFAVEVPK